MREFLVIVDSAADARIATTLAERVLLEKIDWLEQNLLEYQFQWKGFKPETTHTCWKDIHLVIEQAGKRGVPMPRMLGHKPGQNKADSMAARKVLGLAQLLCHKERRPIHAVLLIRDLDNQAERRQGIEQARDEHRPAAKFAIVIGAADKMREAWVLNGFVPMNPEENRLLAECRQELGFDPCDGAHRLRSASWKESERDRNPKFILGKLTKYEYAREARCWEETDLEILRAKGIYTGLLAYLQELERHLVPALSGECTT